MTDPIAPLIIGRGLLTAEAIAAELRDRLVRKLALGRRRQISDQEMIETARRLLAEFEPLLARALADTMIAGWIAGVRNVAEKLPHAAWAAIPASKSPEAALGPGGPSEPPERGSGPPGRLAGDFGGDGPPVVRFPLLEAAADTLRDRRLLRMREYDLTTGEQRHGAFTVAYQDSVAALEAIRTALRESIDQGTSLRDFRERLAAAVDAGPIGPAHLETVYRTNVQSAFAAGHEQLAQDPIVTEVFPYQEYLPTHDGRVRPEHLAMESLGLDGTGVYRRDDPVWDTWTPPCGYNCRCAVVLLTIAQAAARGVREAREWLRTGSPPITPEHRVNFVPTNPDLGFGARPKRRAA